MTWLWLICSSLASGLPALASGIAGQFTLADSREPSVRRLKDFSGVVVWLEPAEGDAPLPPPKTYTLLQRDKKFIPHVLAIPLGATVDFPNADPIFHNAFSNFAGQPFDTGLYPPGSTHKIRFRRDGIVRVFCNIHSTMSAVIVVLKTPWFAVSDSSGGFRMESVPEGDYRLRVWHERATEATLQALERRVRVGPEPVRLAAITISEAGYVLLPHLNKYGKDYPPEPVDRPGYTGGGRR